MEWVSQIMTVVFEMVLPGLAGQWLDKRWGTKFLVFVGFGLGLTTGIWHLIRMTKPRDPGRNDTRPAGDSESESKNR